MISIPIVDGLIKLFDTGLEKWIPDANVRAQAASELASQAHVQIMGQITLNAKEAESPSLYIAGWRPFIGWVCGGAYAYNFVLQPFIMAVLAACGVTFVPPHLDIVELGVVLFGMLGLGAYRTVEKVKGAS